MPPKYIDITGKKIGKLYVKYKSDKKSLDGKYMWYCECECGNTVYYTYSNLKSGTVTCGKCTKNIYEIKEDYVIGYLKDKSKFFLLDKEDFDIIKQYSWRINQHGYVVTNKKINGKKTYIQMHRLIMNAPDNLTVDHINHITYDNRKKNLRLCTQSQNNLNRKIKGYTYRKNGKYEVSLLINGVLTYIGSYNTREEAIQARKNAYDENHKKYCYNNIIDFEEVK